MVVLGDSMADWLAHGLEHAFADDAGNRASAQAPHYSGLIRTSRGDAPDWPLLAREFIAAEKPHSVVMMIGLKTARRSARRRRQAGAQGRRPHRRQQPAPAQPRAQAGNKPAPAPAQAKRGEAAGSRGADGREQPRPRPGRTRRAQAAAMHEFRSEKWDELYTKRIDDTIAAMKSKGVPVFWVGLPAVRGAEVDRPTTSFSTISIARASRSRRHHLCRYMGRVRR